MFVEIVESLRCPREHEPSQLVASATRTENRRIIEGVLGCPVCGAEFPIHDGVLILDPTARVPAGAASVQDAMRIAAFLELTDARGFVVLCGAWGAHVGPLRELCETPVVLVDPPQGAGDIASAVILTSDRVPLAPGSARAAALDSGLPASLTHSVVQSVGAGGRVIGDAPLPVPEGIREIARDERTWVGEKTAAPDPAPRLVTLKRAGT